MRFLGWVFVFLFAINSVAARAEKLDEQEKLQKIKKDITESKQKLKETRIKQQEVLGKLVVIKQELKQANQKISRAKEKIQTNESKIGRLTEELNRHEEDLQMKSGVLERRIREMYKNSGVSYIELLFASSSMSDFLTRFYFFEKIIGQDSSLIKGIRRDLDDAKDKRTVLSSRTQEIKELAQVVIEQKNKIAVQAEEKKKALDELKQREKEYENKIAEEEKSSAELEVLIRKKMAEMSRGGVYAHGSGAFIWPLHGRITSRYGAYRRYGRMHRHTGVDIAASYGSPILAADTGQVIFAGWWDGYGKAIVIDHGRGRATVYGHMSRLYMQAGNQAVKGQTIGLEGNTGNSTGPHLHFEFRKNGVPVNPMPFLP
jgi:murein DD-endopeptidase MepM/ murein hydrolase activator NlpD